MNSAMWAAAWAMSLGMFLAQPSTAPTGATGTAPASPAPPTAPPPPPASTGATGPVGPAPSGTPTRQPPVTTGAPGLPTATGFVPAPQPVIKPTPGVPQNCQCVSVRIEGLAAKQQGQEVRTAIAGVAVDLEAIVKVQCSRPCQPGYNGHWHLTFIPGAQGDRFLVKPRTTARRGAQAVQEIRGEGAAGWYVPPGPGKLIVHWNGRATCDGVVCEQRLSASIELDVVNQGLTSEQKAEVLDAVRNRLPVIAGASEIKEKDAAWRADLRAKGEHERADRVVSPWAGAYDRAVGAWFGQSTGWSPGDRYTQTFDLPGGCALVHGVQVTSTAFSSVAHWAFGDEGLPCGFPAFMAMRVFGQSAEGSVMAQRQGDGARGLLTLNLPVVDDFQVEIRYTDAAGQRRTVSAACAGTVGPRGVVNDPASAPGPGVLRVAVCNVDPSRLRGDDGVMLGRIARMLAEHLGGWTTYGNSERAFDGLGNETQYTDILIGGVHVPAARVADMLKPLADALGAKIVLKGQNIIIQGADVPAREPVLPERLGGQRTR